MHTKAYIALVFLRNPHRCDERVALEAEAIFAAELSPEPNETDQRGQADNAFLTSPLGKCPRYSACLYDRRTIR